MDKSKKKKKTGLAFWVKIIFAFLLVGTISGGLLGVTRRENTPAPVFPPWIAGSTIINYLAGEDARGQMSMVFGKETTVRNAWAAFYSNEEVIWVGQANDDNEAQKLLDIMKNAVVKVISPVPDLKLEALRRKGIEIHKVNFGKQDNYIYQKDDKVFWVSVPEVKANAFLDEVLSSVR